MTVLPNDRVFPDKPPFLFVGTDYLVHFKLSRDALELNVMQAVHIELAHTRDTDSIINALRRFTSLRGNPERIKSDHGINFTAADKELSAAIANWNQDKIHTFSAQRKIEWIFNSPGTSHMGGV